MARDQKFSAKEKKVRKMTRDGLVEVNQATGEQQRISQRGQDFLMRTVSAETAGDSAPLHRGASRGREPVPPAGPPPASGGAKNRKISARRWRQQSPDSTVSAQTQAQEPLPVQPGDAVPTPAPPEAPASVPPPAQSPPDRFQPLPGSAPAPIPSPSPAGNRPKRPHAGRSPEVGTPAPSSEPGPNGGDTPATPPVPDREAPRSRLRFDHAGDAASAKPQRQHTTGYARQFAQGEKPSEQPAGAGKQTEHQAGSTAADQRDGNRQGREIRGDTAQSTDKTHPPGDAPAPAEKRGAAAKLRFAADEKPPESPGEKLTGSRRKAERAEKKLERLSGKVERVDARLDAAREKLPSRKKIRRQRVYDEQKGKARRKFVIEEEVKSRRAHLKGPAPLRPVKAGASAVIGYGHRKLYQVEHENVELKAAHRGELMAEGAARTALRFHKTKPYRRVAKLERAAKRSHVKLSYQKALNENPKLRSSPLSRLMQKRKIKRDYARAAREAKRAGKTIKQTGNVLARTGKALVNIVRRNPKVMVVLALLFLLVLIIMSMASSCSVMINGTANAVFRSTYLAEDEEINAVEIAYTEWETDLQLQIDNAETDHPGYDEYRYDLDEIVHDPFALMAYLTARYSYFTFAEVEADLLEIFAEQYTLEFVEEVEIRTRTVTDSEGNEYEEEYEWYILNIILTIRPFDEILAERMEETQKEHHDQLIESGGNRQYVLNPFSFDWAPYISCLFGWRVHPITGEKDYHPAVDIAVAEGMAILATHDGTVTTATWHDSYGNYIVLDRGDGVVTKYAHCSQLLVSVGQTVEQGEIIGRVGSTGVSTGPHLHFEVLVDGEYINPLFFAERNET